MNILLLCNYDDYELIADIAKKLTSLGNNIYLPYNYLHQRAKHETIINISSILLNNETNLLLPKALEELDKNKLEHTKNILCMEGNDIVDSALLVNSKNKVLDKCTKQELHACFMCDVDIYLLNDVITASKDGVCEINLGGLDKVKPLHGNIYDIFKDQTKKR